MKTPLAAKKFLVECVKDILKNNSSDRYIPIAVSTMTASLEVYH